MSGARSIENAVEVVDLGRVGYGRALEMQRAVHAELVRARVEGRASDVPMRLFLVEHEPVITVSRRPGSGAHLLASPERLAALGIELASTDRGGDITYHGPGQLVAYPIVDLQRVGMGVSGYVRFLEEVIIGTVGSFGIEAHREEGATGVWAEASGGERAEKIAAIGVRIARWVTMHGLALNVTTDLSHFDAIVPCGLAGRRVTSMAKVLGDRAPAMNDVKERLVCVLCATLERRACERRFSGRAAKFGSHDGGRVGPTTTDAPTYH